MAVTPAMDQPLLLLLPTSARRMDQQWTPAATRNSKLTLPGSRNRTTRGMVPAAATATAASIPTRSPIILSKLVARIIIPTRPPHIWKTKLAACRARRRGWDGRPTAAGRTATLRSAAPVKTLQLHPCAAATAFRTRPAANVNPRGRMPAANPRERMPVLLINRRGQEAVCPRGFHRLPRAATRRSGPVVHLRLKPKLRWWSQVAEGQLRWRVLFRKRWSTRNLRPPSKLCLARKRKRRSCFLTMKRTCRSAAWLRKLEPLPSVGLP
mmetsp:Transcript_54947/g.64260  ORF Transcript_54947/g.64260 Transcript_54947/m.64260 type:complete len:267 (-) Transcript_54947:1679-2479(-)